MATFNSYNAINSLKPKRSPYRVYDTGPGYERGLHIQVSPHGSKSWTLAWSRGEKSRFTKLGKWPDVGVKQARELARSAWERIQEGKEPVEAMFVVSSSKSAQTFGDVLDAYVTDCERRGVKSVKFIAGMFKYNVAATMRKRSAASIAPVDIREILVPVATRAPTQHNHLHMYLRRAFEHGLASRFATDRDVHDFGLVGNPVTQVPQLPTSQTKRINDRYPTMEEIAIVWEYAYEIATDSVGAALRFHIACGGIRVQEAIQRRWSDIIKIDGIPALFIPLTKTKVPHLIPIGRFMQEVLDEIRPSNTDGVLFPGMHLSPSVSINSLSNALRKLREELKLGDFSPRNLRAAVKTHLGNAGISRDLLDLHQNHNQRRDVAGKHYDKAHRIREKVQVMNAWDKALEEALQEYLSETKSPARRRAGNVSPELRV